MKGNSVRISLLFILILSPTVINFSCHYFVKRELSAVDKEFEKIVRYRDKAPLEFAYAGEAKRVVTMYDMQPDSSAEKEEASLSPDEKNKNKKSRADSLFEEMIRRAEKMKLKNERDEPEKTDFSLLKQNLKIATGTQPDVRRASLVTSSVDRRKPISSVARKTKGRQTTIGKYISTSDGSANSDSSAMIKSTPRDWYDKKYDEIIYQLQEGKEAIMITTGAGKNYWIGILAAHIFKPGSKGYMRVLDWIIENNHQYQNRTDLDLVRVGDKLNLPTRSMINDLLAAT